MRLKGFSILFKQFFVSLNLPIFHPSYSQIFLSRFKSSMSINDIWVKIVPNWEVKPTCPIKLVLRQIYLYHRSFWLFCQYFPSLCFLVKILENDYHRGKKWPLLSSCPSSFVFSVVCSWTYEDMDRIIHFTKFCFLS